MYIKIDRSKLLPVLNLVSSVVKKRQTLPILSNLFCHLQDGRLKIVGTDLEVEISEIIDGVEGNNGSFTVSARKILDICRMLPENALISFNKDRDKVIVSSGRGRYTLKILEANNFPRIKAGHWEAHFTIKQLIFKSLLNKTSFAMAIQDVRYYLNGILFELTHQQLRAIATDGHRLAQSDVDIEFENQESCQFIVPRRAIIEINRFLDRKDESELSIEISRNHLKLTRDKTVLITKLIDGKFPKFQRVLETELEAVVTVERSEFIETINRASVLTTDRFKGVKVVLDNKVMRITVNNSAQEEVVEEIRLDYKGDVIETGYNFSYLIDAARVISSEKLELHLQGNDGICIIKQPKDSRSTWLIMPMRI